VTSLAGLVAALVAAAAPSHAVQPPVVFTGLGFRPATIRVLRVAERPRSCSVHREHAQAQASRVERAMAPVACEQPPRSEVIVTLTGGLFGNGR